MKNSIVFVCLMAAMVLVACQGKHDAAMEAPAFNLDSAKMLIEKQNEAFQSAFEKKDSVGLAQLYTADAKMMMPGAPTIVGRDGIVKIASMFIKLNVVRSAKTTNLWGSENAMIEEGDVSISDQQGKVLDNAKYLIVWKKEDGVWKMQEDMWNSNLPAK